MSEGSLCASRERPSPRSRKYFSQPQVKRKFMSKHGNKPRKNLPIHRRRESAYLQIYPRDVGREVPNHLQMQSPHFSRAHRAMRAAPRSARAADGAPCSSSSGTSRVTLRGWRSPTGTGGACECLCALSLVP